MKVLCFDIGGTAIKYDILDENTDFNSLTPKKIKTRITKDSNYILEDILKIIDNFKNEIDVVCVSSAGVVDPVKGEIVFAGPTIPGYTNTKIKEAVEREFNKPCYLGNDVNLAAMGEYHSVGYDGLMFFLTIGTGVGGAIILDGKVYTGNSMTAGEIGYMPYKDGYFQDFASTKFLTDYVSQKLQKQVDGYYIFEEARKGNKLCIDAIDLLIENLSFGLLNIIYMLNPKNIVIGGGITAQGKYLEDLIKEKINKKIINKQFETTIKLAKLQNTAGIIGAYYLFEKGNK